MATKQPFVFLIGMVRGVSICQYKSRDHGTSVSSHRFWGKISQVDPEGNLKIQVKGAAGVLVGES